MIATNPGAGASVPPGSSVDIVVSTGRRRHDHDFVVHHHDHLVLVLDLDDVHHARRAGRAIDLGRRAATADGGGAPPVPGRSAVQPAAGEEVRQQGGPLGVRIDSGWNWTPSTARVRWRRPMITPSAVSAVTSSASGTVAGSTTSEW